MDFVDQGRIYVKAGDGGAGCVSFRRERFVPRGGPDGGDGGRGGDVILRVNTGLNTLLSFSRKRHFRAEKGRAGKGKNQHGKSGSDIVIEVPPGTVVKDSENVFVLADLTDPVTNWVAAKGGLGGKGNARFVSSTRQAPRNAQPGLPGDNSRLSLYYPCAESGCGRTF
jgi:GTP-binding protein